MTIRYTQNAPNDAMVFVNYNGAFYSIGLTDIKSVQPILTLPIAPP